MRFPPRNFSATSSDVVRFVGGLCSGSPWEAAVSMLGMLPAGAEPSRQLLDERSGAPGTVHADLPPDVQAALR